MIAALQTPSTLSGKMATASGWPIAAGISSTCSNFKFEVTSSFAVPIENEISIKDDDTWLMR